MPGLRVVHFTGAGVIQCGNALVVAVDFVPLLDCLTVGVMDQFDLMLLDDDLPAPSSVPTPWHLR